MFVDEGPDCLEFDDELLIDDEICCEISKQTTVFVHNGDGDLLLNDDAFFSQTVSQRILVDSLIVAVTKESVSFKRRLAYSIG